MTPERHAQWLSLIEQREMERRWPGWVFRSISDEEIRFLHPRTHGDRLLKELRQSLRDERAELFTALVGRYGEKPEPTEKPRPNFATSAQPIDGAGAEPPVWVRLIPGGTIDTRDGRGPFTMTDPNAVIAATSALDMEAGLPVDFNHSTDRASERGGSSPAAGWIVELQARSGDLFGRVSWTKEGRAAVSRGPKNEPPPYRYLSPVFVFDPRTHAVTQLLRAGLTNWPNLYRSAICTSRNSRENAHSLSADELAICRNLNIRRDVFAAARRES